MADGFDVQFDRKQLAELEERLAAYPKEMSRVFNRAANRTAKTGRTAISRDLAAELEVKKSVLDRHIKVHKANKSKPSALIRIKSRPLNLIAFYARQNGTGVVAKLAGRREQYPHDFIAKGLSGNKLVFERFGGKRTMKAGSAKGKSRQPIRAVPGMSAQALYLRTPGAAKRQQAKLQEELLKNVNHEIEYLLNNKRAEGGEE